MPASRPSRTPRARVYRGTARNVARLARALRRGDLVAVPTETVYGLAGNGLDAAVCRKIFRAKGRPANDPLIIHIHSLRQWPQLAEVSPEALKVAKAFWPGPLTVVLPKKPVVPGEATSGLPSVAVRMPAHPLFRRLLKACALPLAAPSANPFGYISPTEAAHVLASLATKIPHILDGGPCDIGLESTILDLRDPTAPAILRPGAISAKALARVLRRPVAVKKSRIAPHSDAAAAAPGMLSKHYSPRTPLVLHDSLNRAKAARLPVDEAVVFLFRPVRGKRPYPKNYYWLSDTRSLATAGRSLFGTLRSLDAAAWKKIHVEAAPGDAPLALALNDRLTRAAAKR